MKEGEEQEDGGRMSRGGSSIFESLAVGCLWLKLRASPRLASALRWCVT